jgi:hypothetical protein
MTSPRSIDPLDPFPISLCRHVHPNRNQKKGHRGAMTLFAVLGPSLAANRNRSMSANIG